MKKFKDTFSHDWYAQATKDLKEKPIENDPNFANHMIKPCSMIGLFGSTGCGKSTVLVEFLHRCNNFFYEIVIYSGSSTDEPLYRMLKKNVPDIHMIDDLEQLPELQELNNTVDRTKPKLLILDDMINCTKKEKDKMQRWVNAARKAAFTIIILAQNFTDVPIQIRRNLHYFILFRMRDTQNIKAILKRCNANNNEKEQIERAYYECTSQPKHFFMIDLTPQSPAPYRHMFTDIINIA